MRRKRVLAALGAAALLGSLTGCFGDGFTRVGTAPGETAPGLYTASTPQFVSCTPARLRSLNVNDPNSIIALGGSQGGRTYLQVLPTDAAVHSLGCGIWLPARATSYNPNRITMRFGAYRVPNDVLPGTYTAAGSPNCVWERLSNFTLVNNLIATGSGSSHPVVKIRPSDAGFYSEGGCGNWTRIGN